MNILAPINTLESAKALIECGANEIYLGADDKFYQSYSFTGRGKFSYKSLRVLNSFQELKEIVSYAHHNNVKVNFLGNTPFFTDIPPSQSECMFFQYVEEAMRCDVDAVVVGDIGLLQSYGEKKYQVPLHASLYFHTINQEQLKFLKFLGVSRTTLSYQVSMQEIQSLVAAKIMEIEVPGYLGCSFFNGACNCLHELGEGIRSDFDQGITCKSYYEVESNGVCYQGAVFDVEVGCALCRLKQLDEIGVQAVKIVGRDRDHRQNAEVVRLFHDFLHNPERSSEDVPEYWKWIWCKNRRCKYENSPNLKYCI